uniref:Uncharacterized protein n=1 Tax=Tanacetum cinerariifolium TaxID=118510 RepID=A0A699HRM7_TANCI|nr:hypothetical protein [Tanacetum cinerariifolium]
MSSASSAVTYTSVYIDSESGRVFWGADEELSDGGSPRVIMYGYDGLPMLPVAPPSPDYIPGLEEPQTPPAPQDEDEHEPIGKKSSAGGTLRHQIKLRDLPAGKLDRSTWEVEGRCGKGFGTVEVYGNGLGKKGQ